MGSGPEQQWTVAAASYGHMRASHADREHVADVLKTAFVQGRLTKDEFEARIAGTFTARTLADLATAVAAIPPVPAVAPAAPVSRRPVGSGARWGVAGLVTPALLAVAIALPAPLAFVLALVYFVVWLSVGGDMLWEWYALSLVTSRPCVRCAHTAASHRAPESCTAPLGSLSLVRRCTCTGYVPPGLSPRAVDRRMASARS